MRSLSQFNWWDLGLQVGVCFNSLPSKVSLLLGPFDAKYAPKERKKVKRHTRKQRRRKVRMRMRRNSQRMLYPGYSNRHRRV
jgi:hypothetical protein